MVELSNEVMQLDYINLGECRPEQIAALTETNRIWDITNPTLICTILNETFILSGGVFPYDKFTYIEMIPKGMKKIRCFYDGGYSVGDVMCSSNDLMLYFFYRFDVMESLPKDFIRNNLINVMAKFNITWFNFGYYIRMICIYYPVIIV